MFIFGNCNYHLIINIKVNTFDKSIIALSHNSILW